MNDLSHLKRLSAVTSNGGVKFLTHAAYPGNHCPMHTALVLGGHVTGLSTLVIGTPECCNYSRLVVPRGQGEQGELHWLYVLDSHEVVFGCREGVIQALEEMDRAGAKAILLIVTCVPELIGEDMEGILHEVESRLTARLAFVLLGHFKCNSYPSGSWKTLDALGSLMTPLPRRTDLVNVLGKQPEEGQPLPGLLAALEQRGFALRFLGPGATLEDFLQAPEACLNVVGTPFTQPLAQRMEKTFGIPFVCLHSLYGTGEIDRVYGQIGNALGFEWGDEFLARQQELLALEEQAKVKMKGLSFVLGRIGPDRPLPLARYLAELGLEPLLMHMEEFYPEDRAQAKEWVAFGHDLLVCHMVNEEQDLALVKGLHPGLYLGLLRRPSRDFPCVSDLYSLYGQLGYERNIQLLKMLLATLEQFGAAQAAAGSEAKTKGGK